MREGSRERADKLAGCLVGGAIGDAIGLPLEGIRRTRGERILSRGVRYRFLFGKGMVSDDTEHACITGIALARSRGSEIGFAGSVATGLRLWLMTVPAGAGLATLKATLKLCVGVSPARSGVRSAGNGAAMRAAIIGVYFAEDPEKVRRYIEISSRVTHTDQRAIDGAYLVGLAAANLPIDESLGIDRDLWHLDLIERMISDGASPSEFATRIGLAHGISGFVVHTVPVALYCSLWAGDDLRKGIEAALRLGGDTDTVCAIVGGIMGARIGFERIPGDWVKGLWEWPRSVAWMRRLAESMANGQSPPRTFWPAYLARSPLFVATVLAHGVRRLLPPY